MPGTGNDQVLNVSGYDAVWNAINEIAPLDHKIRTRGLKIAYQDMHGIGIETTRALQRVEVDEYSMDLMVLFQKTGILELLSEDFVRALGLDGSARRRQQPEQGNDGPGQATVASAGTPGYECS